MFEQVYGRTRCSCTAVWYRIIVVAGCAGQGLYLPCGIPEKDAHSTGWREDIQEFMGDLSDH